MDCSDVTQKRLEWMGCNDRLSDLYRNGVQEFLDFAFDNLSTSSDVEEEEEEEEEEKKVPCPCNRCNNSRHKTRKDIYEDLLVEGIVKGYVRWIYHGEYKPSRKRVREDLREDSEDIVGMIHEACGHIGSDDLLDEGVGHQVEQSKEADIFDRLIQDAQQTLYPGCDEFSKLSFILKLFQIKCIDGMTNKAFTNMLKLFKNALPKGANLPSTYYEARKMITDLGFGYEKIEACENDCMLFWKDDVNRDKCRVCHQLRNRRCPKVLRYFPITPRLQRLFKSSKTASDMRWHYEKRVDDGILRHPADSIAWKSFNDKHPSFGSSSRNVRLGLASDGFNPFGGLRSDYSIWPVVLVVYNLPPWMCMKQPYSILSLLIPGKSGPGNNIDIYLKPLVEELKQLWEFGVKTYDASLKEYFQMHAAIMWTINDFPAYANLSGWSTKGYKACPRCGNETSSNRLPNCRKCCYMDHRRFLPFDHKWRDSKSFNGKVEKRGAPKPLFGVEVLAQVSDLEDMELGKTITPPKRADNWKKKSIFFKLPYWSSLLLPHNLDVMHIEKNVCDNILGTLLDIEGKSKDGIKARHDLKCMNIMKHLAPKMIDGKWHIPPAPYTLSKRQKEKVYKFLEEVKVPDGYSSNFSKCINLEKRKIWGLKSHDCHVLLEQLLPLAIRGVSESKVYEVIAKLSIFFRNLCSKELKLEDLDNLEVEIVVILCEMEKIFLPSFFDIMVHLCIHLATDAKLGGPVQYRWMYPIERLLHKFKTYVRNKSRPEGSIAEGYIIEECMLFCSRYLSDIETKFNQPERNEDERNDDYQGLSIFASCGIPLGKAAPGYLSDEEWMQARDYVLKNCDEAEPYLNEYDEEVCDKDLSEWFHDRVGELSDEGNNQVVKDLRNLALGPFKSVQRYNGYIANGYRFHTKELESRRRNQNSGVMVRGSNDVDYFGNLVEIISLSYLDGKRVLLFRCDWWDVHKPGRGVKVDKFGFVSVNSRNKLRTNEPFVLMSQAQQVFYVRDGFDPNWLVIIKTQPRHQYNVPENDNYEEDSDALQQSHSKLYDNQRLSNMVVDELRDPLDVERDDIDDMVVDVTDQNQPKDFDGRESEEESEYSSGDASDDIDHGNDSDCEDFA